LIYHSDHIAEIIRGKFILRSENAAIGQLLLDSRKIIFPQSSLFFAIKGVRHNGHAYIEQLYEKGVRNFVVSETPDAKELVGSNIIFVEDALMALQQLAAFHRRRFDIPVIGITGSNGKTIVKEWVNQLLGDRFNIVRSPKSYNSQIGVPLSVWQMNDHHQLAIFEAGISQPGEMQKLQSVIQPTIGIFTNIGAAHSEGFADFRSKVSEKLKLFADVGTLIYCADYDEIHSAVSTLVDERIAIGKPLQVFNWSHHQHADLSITGIEKKVDSTIIKANYQGSEIAIEIPFTDEASIENAIDCWCLMLFFDIPSSDVSIRMAELGRVAMRLELKEGINNCSVINDSYSADLSSLQIALDFLSHQQQHAKKTVILSDILETGKSAESLYREVALLLAQHNISRLIGIGTSITDHSILFSLRTDMQSIFFPSVESFKENFPHLHFQDETILLKGARIFQLEEISRMLEQQVHQTVMEIDLDALAHNLSSYKQLLSPGTKIMAMVKAFSYGSGSYEIASMLEFHKVDYLAVAYTDEGVELRKGGISLPIMVMNCDESSFPALVQYNLEPELYSPALYGAFDKYLSVEGISEFPVHIELETGMNRLGFETQDVPWLLEKLKQERFIVKSVFTHLVASEDPQHDAFTKQQASLFDAMLAQFRNELPYDFISHIANSSGTSRHPYLQHDMVRLGIGLYGIDSGAQKAGLNLRQVSTLKSTIAQIKKLHEGDTVGYGRSGVITRNSIIATVRIGYADGYPRQLGNGVGKMWINGRFASVIGTVCMDMTMIDITDIPAVSEGDEVIVFGHNLPVQNVAAWASTIPYEILTGISQRVKRVYFQE
jgi:Alr-MurF fusion protein